MSKVQGHLCSVEAEVQRLRREARASSSHASGLEQRLQSAEGSVGAVMVLKEGYPCLEPLHTLPEPTRKVLTAFSTLPVSTAACERGFGTVNHLLTDQQRPIE
jgi:hypothetical protein